MVSLCRWWIWKDLKGTSRDLFQVSDKILSSRIEENGQVLEYNRCVWRSLKPWMLSKQQNSQLNMAQTVPFSLSRRKLQIVLAVWAFSWAVVPEFMSLIPSIKLCNCIQDAQTFERPFVASFEQLTQLITLSCKEKHFVLRKHDNVKHVDYRYTTWRAVKGKVRMKIVFKVDVLCHKHWPWLALLLN